MDLRRYKKRSWIHRKVDKTTVIVLMFVEAWLMLAEHKRISGALSFVQTRYVEPNSLVLGWLMYSLIAFGIVSAGGIWLILWYQLGGKTGSLAFFVKAYKTILYDIWLKIKES